MIIEIKGLPEGQLIKHINVDITFTEDGSPIIKTESTSKFDTSKQEYTHSQKPDDPVLRSENDDTQSVVPPSIPEQRAPKDIPPEMNDLEF